MADKASQVMEIAACDRQTAHRLLQQNKDDVMAAINAYLDPTAGTEYSSHAVVPYSHDQSPMNTSPLTSVRPLGPAQESSQLSHSVSNVQETSARSGPTPPSERTSKKRNTPVDLTGEEEDEDLRKAMQASLESETNRQKRQQEYGYSTRLGGKSVNDDDEALSRAIEASMQQSTSATRAQTPQNVIQDFDAMGRQTLRPPDQPVAIMSSTPFMRLFACSLQALYAAPAIRKALLSLRLTDVRLKMSGGAPISMENYWQGIGPAGISDFSEALWSLNGISGTEGDKAAIEATMRLVTLFVFLNYTKRPLCVADDVISRPMKSNYAYVMNSARKPASDIVSCNLQATLEAINLAVDCIYKSDSHSLLERKSALQSACSSYTANAVTPQNAEIKSQRKPKDHYETFVLQLIHNNVNTSVHKAIYGHLSDDKSLFTSTADTLFLSIGRIGINPLTFGYAASTEQAEAMAPFQVEKILYMDQFMFEKRNGVRLGLDTDRLKDRKARLEELEKYRKTIGVHQGIESRMLLASTIKYFETACNIQDADEIRLTSNQEAEVHLKKLLVALEKEVTRIDLLIDQEKKAIDDERNEIMTGFLDGLKDPNLQKNCYELQAVLMNNEETAWSYVRHEPLNGDVSNDFHSSSIANDPSWWRICDGQCIKVTEEHVFSDVNNVFFLVYTRRQMKDADATVNGVVNGDGDIAPMTSSSLSSSQHSSNTSHSFHDNDNNNKPNKTMRLDSESDWWNKTILAECIEIDNAAFGRQLASMARGGEEEEVQQQQQPIGREDRADLDLTTGDNLLMSDGTELAADSQETVQ